MLFLSGLSEILDIVCRLARVAPGVFAPLAARDSVRAHCYRGRSPRLTAHIHFATLGGGFTTSSVQLRRDEGVFSVTTGPTRKGRVTDDPSRARSRRTDPSPEPRTSGGVPLEALQRAIGNRAVCSLLPQASHRADVKPESQRSGPRRSTAPVAGLLTGATPGTVVQRHASPEHLALGTISQNSLGGVADAKDLIRQLGKAGIGNATVQNAIHLLVQERKRVRDWQASPPADVAAGSDFGVRAVEIAPGVIGTYGEMNTLADYFGSLDDLKAVQPATVTKVLQTEREDFYGWLGKQLTDLTKADYVERKETMVVGGGMARQAVTVTVKYFKNERAYLQDDGGVSAPYNVKGSPGLVDQAFEGTQSGLTTNLSQPLEKVVSGVSGQHGADLPVRTDPGTVARGTGGAWGAIARNACHFAPESWYAWKKYHLEARQHAIRSHQLGSQGNTAAADREANEAWLANGFGDHYLQDSFASGHLINKTLIMQWFMEWAKTWKVVGPLPATWTPCR